MSTMKNEKLLVANRSEIACRVFQTAREMGITTVGIYAPGDEEARHLSYADEIAPVTGYLHAESIVEAAKKLGVTMIHPGYGFLSERPHFAALIEKAGIRFLGPTAETMQSMGGKIDAKERAIASGVPTLPWAKVSAGQDLKPLAKSMGYPVLLKAAAGGGGKGMRRVDRAEDLDAAAESASGEAITSFGDGTLFMEKLVVEPRHIEVQVFGDGRGGAVGRRAGLAGWARAGAQDGVPGRQAARACDAHRHGPVHAAGGRAGIRRPRPVRGDPDS